MDILLIVIILLLVFGGGGGLYRGRRGEVALASEWVDVAQFKFVPPSGDCHGETVQQGSVSVGKARDAQTQSRHSEKWLLGCHSEKPQAGNRNRTLGGATGRPESAGGAVAFAMTKERLKQ